MFILMFISYYFCHSYVADHLEITSTLRQVLHSQLRFKTLNLNASGTKRDVAPKER